MDVMDQPNLAGGAADVQIAELTPELARKRRGQLRIIFDRFMRNRVAVLGFVALLIIVGLAVFAPIITHATAKYQPDTTIPPNGCLFCGPTYLHPLGTDELGRDVLARVLFGARVSLVVGAASMLVAILIGVTIGAIAGYAGGAIDNVLMRIVDAALATPYLLLLLVLSLIFSNGSVPAVVFLIAIISWADTARIVRGQFLSLKEREFLLASRTLGASGGRLILRHLLPNSAGPIIVQATLLVGANIITESVLSFFGYGLAPPQASWGSMLSQSQDFYFNYPILLYAPGLMILITVLCFNLMGDGLRDALDPYMTER
jgi:peptide/nickel transport system permease protein